MIDYARFANEAIKLYRARRLLLPEFERVGLDASIGEEIILKLAIHAGAPGADRAIAEDMVKMRIECKEKATI